MKHRFFSGYFTKKFFHGECFLLCNLVYRKDDAHKNLIKKKMKMFIVKGNMGWTKTIFQFTYAVQKDTNN